MIPPSRTPSLPSLSMVNTVDPTQIEAGADSEEEEAEEGGSDGEEEEKEKPETGGLQEEEEEEPACTDPPDWTPAPGALALP